MRIGGLGFVQNIAHSLGRINRRLRVRHTQKARHAARRSRTAARVNIFFIGKARVTQMHMHIHKARHRR